MISWRDQQELTTVLKTDAKLRNNMLRHGLVQRLVNGDYMLTAKGEAEIAERDRHAAGFAAVEKLREQGKL
jgi:hypothetical protein